MSSYKEDKSRNPMKLTSWVPCGKRKMRELEYELECLKDSALGWLGHKLKCSRRGGRHKRVWQFLVEEDALVIFLGVRGRQGDLSGRHGDYGGNFTIWWKRAHITSGRGHDKMWAIMLQLGRWLRTDGGGEWRR